MKAEVADLLARMNVGRLFRALGFEDLVAYAAARGLDVSARQVRELVATVKALEVLPGLGADFRSGELTWTKVRTVAPVATPETEERWREDARRLSNRALERLAAEERGEPVTVRYGFTLTPEQEAWREKAFVRVREQAGRTLTDAEVLELLCRAWLQGGDRRGAGQHPAPAAARIVLDHCVTCRETTLETREGPVPLAPATLERVQCDAEVLDIRQGPSRVTRTVPPRTVSYVRARDRGRCQVDGCTGVAFLELHHEPDRRTVGHDHRRMVMLCLAHHQARHEGLLVISGQEHPFRFALADGTPIEAPRSREQSSRAAPVAAGSRAEPVAAVAVRELRALDVPRAEARRLVRGVLASRPPGAASLTVEALVKEALRARPGPGARASA